MFNLINKHILSPIILFVVSVSHIDIGFIEVDTLILEWDVVFCVSGSGIPYIEGTKCTQKDNTRNIWSGGAYKSYLKM